MSREREGLSATRRDHSLPFFPDWNLTPGGREALSMTQWPQWSRARGWHLAYAMPWSRLCSPAVASPCGNGWGQIQGPPPPTTAIPCENSGGPIHRSLSRTLSRSGARPAGPRFAKVRGESFPLSTTPDLRPRRTARAARWRPPGRSIDLRKRTEERRETEKGDARQSTCCRQPRHRRTSRLGFFYRSGFGHHQQPLSQPNLT